MIMWSVFLMKGCCHTLSLLFGSVNFQILKNWTTGVSATSNLSQDCGFMTAPNSNAYRRRGSLNPFQNYLFSSVIRCSKSVARNHMVKTGGRLLTLNRYLLMTFRLMLR